MIAIVQFKGLPGKRFEVMRTDPSICGPMKRPTCCALFKKDCEALGADAICMKGFYFKKIKEAK